MKIQVIESEIVLLHRIWQFFRTPCSDLANIFPWYLFTRHAFTS